MDCHEDMTNNGRGVCNEGSLQDKSDFLLPYLENWRQIGCN